MKFPIKLFNLNNVTLPTLGMDNRLVLAVVLVTLSWLSMGTYAQNTTTANSTNANATMAPNTTTANMTNANATMAPNTTMANTTMANVTMANATMAPNVTTAPPLTPNTTVETLQVGDAIQLQKKTRIVDYSRTEYDQVQSVSLFICF